MKKTNNPILVEVIVRLLVCIVLLSWIFPVIFNNPFDITKVAVEEVKKYDSNPPFAFRESFTVIRFYYKDNTVIDCKLFIIYGTSILLFLNVIGFLGKN